LSKGFDYLKKKNRLNNYKNKQKIYEKSQDRFSAVGKKARVKNIGYDQK
jgi:hypothetical protein